MAKDKPTAHMLRPLAPSVQAEINNTLQQALSLHRGGQPVQADWMYQQVLKLHPNQLDALQMLGVLKFQSGKMEEGVALLRRVVAIDPRQAGAYNNLGNALRQLGQHEAAIESLDRAIALAPGFADAHSNRGNALHALQQYPAALESFEQAIALQPGHANAFNNRGTTLISLRRYTEAVQSFDAAIALKPDFAEAYVHRSAALIGLQQYPLALQDCDTAAALSPRLVLAHRNRAVILSKTGRHQEAADAYGDVLALDPLHAYAAGDRMNALLYVCNWHGYTQQVAALTQGVRRGERVVPPFTFFVVAPSPADQLACARIWSDDKNPAALQPLWTGERHAHTRIRLAYLSADFQNHATAYLTAELFELHDRERFECTAYSFGPPDAPGEMRGRLRGAFEHFVDVSGMDDLQVAQLMQSHGIDIAVDLKGFTADGRPGILAQRSAPIQVNYLGYPGTMGAGYIDYILTDAVVTPPAQDAYFTEHPVRLPHSYQANDRRRVISPIVPMRATSGLPDNGFVFCCFNNNYKIAPVLFDIWMRLLQKVPGSVLWLLQDNADAAANLRSEAQQRGISPERLVFAQRVNLPEHLARHRLADLFLDTLPCNAHTTASDALWAGLPVLTCLGTAFAGRVAASLITAVGLPELVTESLADYEALALELATQPGRLDALRARLAAQRDTCALFDTDRFRRHIESAYETMYMRYQNGLAPEAFSVQPPDAGH